MKEKPQVGVGVIVVRDGKILLGKRKGSHGEGTWCFPGGRLEFKESLEDCAQREVMEEAGISIKNIEKVAYTNDVFEKENKHYLTCYLKADYKSGEVLVMEPNKCEEWRWFDWNNLPKPLFLPIQNLLKQGFDPFTSQNF